MLVELMLAILILMVIRFSLSFFLAARCGKKSEDFTFRSSKRIHLWNVHLCCSIDTPIRVHPKFTVTNLFYPRLSSDLKVFFGILRTNIDKQNKQIFTGSLSSKALQMHRRCCSHRAARHSPAKALCDCAKANSSW